MTASQPLLLPTIALPSTFLHPAPCTTTITIEHPPTEFIKSGMLEVQVPKFRRVILAEDAHLDARTVQGQASKLWQVDLAEV